MSLIKTLSSPVVLRLNRDLVRTIKRGHPWVYADALRDLPRAPAGSPALLLDNKKGQPVARGYYDSDCPVALRICETDPETSLDDRWVQKRLQTALSIRQGMVSNEQTTGYRLFNGEGDGTPGLVVDLYGDAAVIKLDGEGPRGFWNAPEIASLISHELPVTRVYERLKERGSTGRALVGETPAEPVHFVEHGLRYTADLVRGQKTGFFLDQRENRQTIRSAANGARVLNVFSYTGGFSIAAGTGGATHVTSVDVAPAAIEAANHHWMLNGLAPECHDGVAADAFEFLEEAFRRKQRWDIVVLDPPSFAPNRESLPKAVSAYENVIEAGARVTARSGKLAIASCSSHVDLSLFLQCCEEGISRARRRGTVLTIAGQPMDHPTPLALPEFRYLKFALIQLD